MTLFDNNKSPDRKPRGPLMTSFSKPDIISACLPAVRRSAVCAYLNRRSSPTDLIAGASGCDSPTIDFISWKTCDLAESGLVISAAYSLIDAQLRFIRYRALARSRCYLLSAAGNCVIHVSYPCSADLSLPKPYEIMYFTDATCIDDSPWPPTLVHFLVYLQRKQPNHWSQHVACEIKLCVFS